MCRLLRRGYMKGVKKMSKFTENMKNWGNNHPKTMRFGKALATALAKGVAESTIGQLNAPPPVVVGDTEVLTADQIDELNYMSISQLKAIFQGRKVSFATDKETLEALNWLSTSQINAILGRE